LPDNGLERNRQSAYQVYTGNGDEKKWVGGYQEGQRPGDLYMFVAEGLYKSQDEIPANLIDLTTGNNGSSGRPLYGGTEGYNKLTDSQKSNALPIQPGDVKWKDVNNDGVIDNYDMVKVGNTVPKWTGGINTTVSWKDLTLSARFDYALGFTAVDWKTMWIMSCAQGTYNTIEETKNTWTPENPNAKYPRLTSEGSANNYTTNSLWVADASYMKLRTLELYYNFSQEMMKKSKFIKGAKVFARGHDLFCVDKIKVLDPENIGTNHPTMTQYTFGVNLSF